MEVHRTCQFVTTVLTPAITGNGGSTYRFDGHNIQAPAAILQQINLSTQILANHVRQAVRLPLYLGLVAALDHDPGEVLGP